MASRSEGSRCAVSSGCGSRRLVLRVKYVDRSVNGLACAKCLSPLKITALTAQPKPYDVSPDDQRFLMIQQIGTEAAGDVVSAQNLFE